MGYPSGTQGTQLLDWSRQRDVYAGSYFQDDWKVTSQPDLPDELQSPAGKCMIVVPANQVNPV